MMHDGQWLVLVLDDDQAVRDSLKFALETEGLEVSVFSKAQDLLAYPRLHEAGCLVLDHDMPSVGGFEGVARLTARHPDLPVILMTDHANGILRRRAAAASIRHVVEKPLLNGALIESIHDVLRTPREARTAAPT